MKTPDGRVLPNWFSPVHLSDGTPLTTLSGTGTRRTLRAPDGTVIPAPATCNPYSLDAAAAKQGVGPAKDMGLLW